MSNTPEFNAEQLAAARSKSWHQNADPLLTLDSVRDWITASGIVLFAPRSLQLPVPAPSLVEATLGASSGGPTPQQIDVARGLVARLVAEGNVLPLNLLGNLGDTPDFIVSAQVFSFVFTLRGDKAWKQAPGTSGSVKVSPLAVRVYEVLTEKGALTAAELASELGRELTEAAILRALNELWSHLRVIPLLAQGDKPSQWELTSRRFTKAIKAGTNAGQPTALSALISLYLAQSLLASEEEVEIFLSPLAARSRIREVLHALTGSRQLETIVLDGKSLSTIPGTLPEFPAIEKPEPTEEELAATAAAEAATLEGEGRIKSFKPRAGTKTLSDFKGKPARSFGSKPAFGGARPTSRSKPAFGAKPAAERRPFTRDAKPTFTKPWEEDRKPTAEGEEKPKRAYTPRATGERSGQSARPTFAKKPYTPRTEGGDEAPKRPYTPRASSDRPSFAKKPYAPRKEGSSFAKKPYAPRSESRSEGATTGSYPKRPYTPRENSAGGDRPARPAVGTKRSFGDKSPYAAKRPFTPREDSGERSDQSARPTPPAFRKFDAPKRPFTPRVGGRPDKPAYGGSNSKPRAPKPEGSFEFPTGKPKRPFPRAEGDLADRPVRAWPTKTGRSDGRPGGPGSKPRAPRKDFADRGERSERPARTFGDRPARPSFGDRPARPSFGDRPARPAFGSRPSAGKSFGAKNGEGRGFSKKPGGFSKRPTPSGDKVSFDSKPAPRRGIPGTKPSFPRKPRNSEE